MSEGLIVLYALIGWTAVITVVAVGLRWVRGRPTPTDAALEELRARYARAEMTHEEYERKRRDLVAGGDPEHR